MLTMTMTKGGKFDIREVEDYMWFGVLCWGSLHAVIGRELLGDSRPNLPEGLKILTERTKIATAVLFQNI